MIRTIALATIVLATASLALAKPTPRPGVVSPRDCAPAGVIGPSMTTGETHATSTGATTVSAGRVQCANHVSTSNVVSPRDPALVSHAIGQGGIIAPTDTNANAGGIIAPTDAHANAGGIVAPTDAHQAPGSPDSPSEPPGSPDTRKH